MSWGLGSAARLTAAALGLPKEGRTPVKIQIVRPSSDIEEWRRWFGERLYVSRQRRVGMGRHERWGPVEIRYRVELDGSRVAYVQESSWLRLRRLTIRLPRWLSPAVSAHAEQCDAVRFFVAVGFCLPFVGRVLHYQGYITEEE